MVHPLSPVEKLDFLSLSLDGVSMDDDSCHGILCQGQAATLRKKGFEMKGRVLCLDLFGSCFLLCLNIFLVSAWSFLVLSAHPLTAQSLPFSYWLHRSTLSDISYTHLLIPCLPPPPNTHTLNWVLWTADYCAFFIFYFFFCYPTSSSLGSLTPWLSPW